MEKCREDLKACPACGVLNSLQNPECYACDYRFVKDLAELVNCEYFNPPAGTCLARCYHAGRR